MKENGKYTQLLHGDKHCQADNTLKEQRIIEDKM